MTAYQRKLDIYVNLVMNIVDTYRIIFRSPWLRAPLHLCIGMPLMLPYFFFTLIWDDEDLETITNDWSGQSDGCRVDLDESDVLYKGD